MLFDSFLWFTGINWRAEPLNHIFSLSSLFYVSLSLFSVSSGSSFYLSVALSLSLRTFPKVRPFSPTLFSPYSSWRCGIATSQHLTWPPSPNPPYHCRQHHPDIKDRALQTVCPIVSVINMFFAKPCSSGTVQLYPLLSWKLQREWCGLTNRFIEELQLRGGGKSWIGI